MEDIGKERIVASELGEKVVPGSGIGIQLSLGKVLRFRQLACSEILLLVTRHFLGLGLGLARRGTRMELLLYLINLLNMVLTPSFLRSSTSLTTCE